MEDKDMENKKVLVAFFSHTGENFFPGGMRRIEKGNTHIAAEMIAEVCNADLFEIKTVVEYSDIYKECVEQAKNDMATDARPELKEDMDIRLETNTKIQAQWKFFEKEQHKRRRCFVKNL